VSAPAGAVGTYRKTGKMTISLAVQRRFWPKVALTGDDASGCWLWTAATIRGYGAINIAGQARYAHRVAYEMWRGPIPDGLDIDHLCRPRSASTLGTWNR